MIEVELACTLVCTVALVSYAIVQVAYSSIIHSASIIVYLCCYTVLVDVHITRKTVKTFSVSLASSLPTNSLTGVLFNSQTMCIEPEDCHYMIEHGTSIVHYTPPKYSNAISKNC